MTDKEKAKMQVEVERAYKKGFIKAACIEYGRPCSEVASKLGIPVSTVRAWKKKLEMIELRKEVLDK